MMDPFQFAYQADRGVNDAKIYFLNTIHKHLEIPKTTARLLFTDFSSTINTMQPHILADKLITHFHLNNQLTLWIIFFLTNRSQRENHTPSNTLFAFTGSPQGCVLSPTQMTADPTSQIVRLWNLLKTLSSCLCLPATHITAQLCRTLQNGVELLSRVNISKTKEMIVTFSPKHRQMAEAVTTILREDPVEIVEEYKCLGTLFDYLLSFSSNTEEILKKCHQRQYLLYIYHLGLTRIPHSIMPSLKPFLSVAGSTL